MRIKTPCDRSKTYNISERANNEQLFSPDAINEIQTNKCKNQIGAADGNRIEQRIFCPEPCTFKNFRSIIQNKIDAAPLVKECNEKSKPQNSVVFAAEDMLIAPACFYVSFAARISFISLSGSSSPIITRISLARFKSFLMRDQPPRTFGHTKHH